MNYEETKREIEQLSDRILSHLTLEEAVELDAYLDKKYPYNTEAGKLCDKIFIDTGAGESLAMLVSAAKAIANHESTNKGIKDVVPGM